MNPWGAYEWKGDYCDNSSLWTSELKKALGLTSLNDCIFFIKFEDYLKFFSCTCASKYKKGFYYNWNKFIQIPNDTVVCAKIVIGLIQKQKRFYRKVNNYTSKFCRLILAQYVDNKYKYITSNASENEKTYMLESSIFLVTYIGNTLRPLALMSFQHILNLISN